MKINYEGTFIANIKYTHYDTNTKKLSYEITNSIYRIRKINDVEYLVELNNLTKKINMVWIFFESPDGLTSVSDGNVNRIFQSCDKIIIHAWSSQIDANGIISNGHAELESACAKCK